MAARRGSIIPLIIAGLLGLVLVLVVRQWVGGGNDGDGGDTAAGGDPGATTTGAQAPAGCTTVSIVASSEKAALLGTLAQTYNGSSPQVDGTCMWMSVSTKASGAAATALARGWDEKVDGTRPDVWSPRVQFVGRAGRPGVHRPRPPKPDAQGAPVPGADPARDRHAPAHGPGPGLAGGTDRLEGSRRDREVAEGVGQQGPSGVGPLQARQDQPVLLDVRAERHDRVLLRRHRRLQRPHIRAGGRS